MKMIKLKLGGEMKDAEFTDISGEEWRKYLFAEEVLPDGRIRRSVSLQINGPAYLNVSPSGGHRILDKEGISHYVPCGWKHLSWKANPHFVK
jgi:hypothetical protein